MNGCIVAESSVWSSIRPYFTKGPFTVRSVTREPDYELLKVTEKAMLGPYTANTRVIDERSTPVWSHFFKAGQTYTSLDRLEFDPLKELGTADPCVESGAGDELRERGFGSHSGILQQETHSGVYRVPDFTTEFVGTESKGEIVVVGMFIFVAALFVPVGLIIARLFEQMPPILAYAVNISGALLGTLLFVPISFTQLGPQVWSLIGLASLRAELEWPNHLVAIPARLVG